MGPALSAPLTLNAECSINEVDRYRQELQYYTSCCQQSVSHLELAEDGAQFGVFLDRREAQQVDEEGEEENTAEHIPS